MIFFFNCSSLVETQVKHVVQSYHIVMLTGGDFKSALVSPAPANLLHLLSPKQMITVLYNLCRPEARSSCSPFDMDILPSVLSSKHSAGTRPIKCLLLLLLWIAKWQLYNLISLVSVNRSYIKKSLKMPHGCLYTILYMLMDAILKKFLASKIVNCNFLLYLRRLHVFYHVLFKYKRNSLMFWKFALCRL